jgi:hypothetical protein
VRENECGMLNFVWVGEKTCMAINDFVHLIYVKSGEKVNVPHQARTY